MTINEVIAELEKVRDEVGGDKRVAQLFPYDEFFGFDFEFEIVPVGMPNEQETAEETVCVFMHPDTPGYGESGPPKPKRKFQVVT